VSPSVNGLQRLPDDDHGCSSWRFRGKPRTGHRELADMRSGVMFHGLRHGCASLLVMGDLTGKPAAVAVVQRWMGHASIATTMGYAHLAPDFLHHVAADVRDAIPPSQPRLRVTTESLARTTARIVPLRLF
jgi:integrase